MLKILLNRKVNLIALIYIVHLTFSYYYFPWFFSALIGFGIIVTLSYFTWPKNYIFWLGFPIRKRDYLYTYVSFLLFVAASYFIITNIAKPKGIQVNLLNYKQFIHVIFYTLNEEIVLGALLLKGIKYYRKKTPDWFVSVAVAMLFLAFHVIFFKWIFTNSGTLGVITIISLFAAGVFRNNLILKTGHIGFSWAVHFAWIYIMLGSSHYMPAKNIFLNDFDRFELYLGDFRTMIACLICAVISFIQFKKLLFPNNSHSVT